MPITGSINGLFATVTLDGNGNGTAKLGPSRPREHWLPNAASVSAAPVPPATKTNINAQCSVYAGAQVAPSTFVSNTVTGSTGDTCTMNGVDLQPGMFIFAVWSGGDPGAVATVRMLGTYRIGT